jgi:hypothetical protein
MKAFRYFGIITIGVAMLGAGATLAQEPTPPADPAQRDAYREQMQERMRNMTPEEQRLMRESSVDGRTRMENRQSAQGDGKRRGGGEGGGYGKGYESRRADGSGGGGRGRGGGRQRSANEDMTP